jgi:predicted kinase
MMPSVYVLMGLPGSGKTTWRNRFVAEREGAAHAVARDDVVEKMAGLHGITYAEAWRTFSKTIDKEFRRRLTEAFTLDKDVVVDNTNLTAKARRRIFSRVPEDWEKVGVIFDVPEQCLVDRLLTRAGAGGKRVAPWLVPRMRLDWVPPAPDDFDRLLIVRPGCDQKAAELLFLGNCPNSEPTTRHQGITGASSMPKQPDIPATASTPAAATDNPPPPSRFLHQSDAGMVSQADVQDIRDEKLERDRRANLNPSLAREEPIDTGKPGNTPSDRAGPTD